jgi:alpha-ketoglutarate-dependent 2,4-dichlorophenoxyacetate dioxygenase
VLAAWRRHAVLVFPGQHLSEEAQVAFSQRLGPLERGVPRRGRAAGEPPKIGRLANVGGDGRPVPEGSSLWLFLKGNQDWHSDSSFKRVSAKASLLSAWRVPSCGGETEWADMRAAWDALGRRARAQLEGLVAVHSYWYSQSQVGGTDVLSAEDWAGLPPVEHPVVRTNEDSGRRSLFIGRHASHIRGMDEHQGRQLLAELCRYATRPCWRLRHRWAPGDAVLWDNRSVLHRGRPWPASEARVMKRTTVAGAEPADGGHETAICDDEGEPTWSSARPSARR